MRLETPRLALDPLRAADAPHIYAMMSDPEVRAHWDGDDLDDPDAVNAVVTQRVQDMGSGRARHWTMRTLEDDAFVGCVDLSQIDLAERQADIGFMLRRDSWGQGYSLEATRTVITHAAMQGFRRLTAVTIIGDRRSDLLLQNLGFEEEARQRGLLAHERERRDRRLWALVL